MTRGVAHEVDAGHGEAPLAPPRTENTGLETRRSCPLPWCCVVQSGRVKCLSPLGPPVSSQCSSGQFKSFEIHEDVASATHLPNDDGDGGYVRGPATLRALPNLCSRSA